MPSKDDVRADAPPMEQAQAEADAAKERASNQTDTKLNDAELAAIEEDALRRRFSTPQREPTTSPPRSANNPPHPTMEEIMADLKYPASRGDLVSRARDRGAAADDRYKLERIEDRLYVSFEQVEAALRAA